jgi:hypothetical protein
MYLGHLLMFETVRGHFCEKNAVFKPCVASVDSGWPQTRVERLGSWCLRTIYDWGSAHGR